MELDRKIAVVTGASRGIGRSIALTLADAGADLVGCDLLLDDLEEVVKEISAKGGKGLAVKTDVSQERDVNQMIQRVVEEFGRVDILVNNAAYPLYSMKYFNEADITEWDQQINVTFKGVLRCCKAIIPYMIAQKSGKIINITSTSARVYSPRMAVYAACKAAVASFSRCIAAELGPYGIHVNCVAPHAIVGQALDQLPKKSRKGTAFVNKGMNWVQFWANQSWICMSVICPAASLSQVSIGIPPKITLIVGDTMVPPTVPSSTRIAGRNSMTPMTTATKPLVKRSP